MARRLPQIALVLVGVIVLLTAFVPEPFLKVLRNVTALWDALLMVAALLTLVWFVYWVFLRKLLRARRIANLRMRRLMDELGEGPRRD
jgi:hypothetical protein